MHSPLPDSSALEAGILEDEQPSRLSRVQDNVRNLLRNSRFSSTQNSPRPGSPLHHGLPTPPQSPTHHRRHGMSPQPEVLASPAESTNTTTSSNLEPTTPDALAEVHFPPASYRRTVQQMAHQSSLFNTRAVAALNHPDLSDPSLAVLIQNTSQRRAWKRSRKGGDSSSKRTRAKSVFGSSQWFLCVLAALLLSAIVATYVVLATTSSNITPTFHILFILGILLATIVFAHTVVRLFLFSGSSRRVFIVRSAKHRHHRHHRRDRHNRPPRLMPPVASNEATAFVPATPIPVHMPADEVRPDSREAQPTATPSIAPLSTSNDRDKDADPVPNPPPPAYGRWRGSVRANPDLLHWQVLPSPVDADAHELPSPTYEEATRGAQTAPPSYVTRESPARRRAEAVREVPIEEEAAREGQEAQFVTAEPEMVEGVGIGLGL